MSRVVFVFNRVGVTLARSKYLQGCIPGRVNSKWIGNYEKFTLNQTRRSNGLVYSPWLFFCHKLITDSFCSRTSVLEPNRSYLRLTVTLGSNVAQVSIRTICQNERIHKCVDDLDEAVKRECLCRRWTITDSVPERCVKVPSRDKFSNQY